MDYTLIRQLLLEAEQRGRQLSMHHDLLLDAINKVLDIEASNSKQIERLEELLLTE